jgi:formate dehydrogenase assembly factor FdhD
VNARLAMIVRKREALVARATAQRQELVTHAAGLQRLLQIGNTAMDIGRTLRLHPALTAVAVTTLMEGFARRHRFFLWAGRAFTLWELFRVFREQWARGRAR